MCLLHIIDDTCADLICVLACSGIDSKLFAYWFVFVYSRLKWYVSPTSELAHRPRLIGILV